MMPVDWVEERSGAISFGKFMLFRNVPKDISWLQTLGSALITVFILQATTGIILAMYYQPTPETAWMTIQWITNEATLGWLVRGMHKWGSSVMVVLLFLHMGRTFLFGAYKYTREMTWITGAIIFILVMGMSFTGYLLVFDERAYWATIVGVNINGTGPLVGPYLSEFLRAGPYFGATTLSRFYAIHMLMVPGAIAALMGFHLYLVAKLGTTAPPWVKAKPSEELSEEKVTVG